MSPEPTAAEALLTRLAPPPHLDDDPPTLLPIPDPPPDRPTPAARPGEGDTAATLALPAADPQAGLADRPTARPGTGHAQKRLHRPTTADPAAVPARSDTGAALGGGSGLGREPGAGPASVPGSGATDSGPLARGVAGDDEVPLVLPGAGGVRSGAGAGSDGGSGLGREAGAGFVSVPGSLGSGADAAIARGAGRGGESISQRVARRRGPADPVRAVMHRHQGMIAGAVDAWEIAAGLEAYGVNDGEARRLRHRDVFGLAEELYARVPRAVRVAAVGERATGRARLGARRTALHLLPGAGCVLAAGLPTAAVPVAVLVAVALWAALRGGPLRTAHGAGAALWTYGLLGFALCGPQAVTALAGRGRFDAGAGTAGFAALALSLLPAAALAGWFAVAARAQLAPSHSIADFADAVRPRLAAALAGYAAVLTALLLTAAAMAGSAPLAGPAALGVLLFTARLLAVHGHPVTAAACLAAACVAEALTLVLAAAPGHLAPSGGSAEAAVCGAAAAVLAARAFRLLARPAAHH